MTTNMTSGKLQEVLIMRPVLILSIVIGHSFAIYSGEWQNLDGLSIVEAYRWIHPVFVSFQLQAFVCISGYLFFFRKSGGVFLSFVKSKFKRLILPALFFSVIYYFMFSFDASNFSISHFLKTLLSGAGHMWFLPMLFWCFVGLWVVNSIKVNPFVKLLLLGLLSLLPIPIPFGIGRACHFLFYAYGGYVLCCHKNFIIKSWAKPVIFVPFIGAYVLSFVVFSVWGEILMTEREVSGFFVKIFYTLCLNVNRLMVSVTGILALYLVVCYYVYVREIKLFPWIVVASSICYGVYIFHQFILIALYYETGVSHLLGAYLLPWVGLCAALVVSIFLSKITLKTKLGRFLIG